MLGGSCTGYLVRLSKIRGFWQIFQEKLAEGMEEWIDSRNAASLAQAASNVSALQLPVDQKRSIWQEFSQSLGALPAVELRQAEEFTGLFKIVEMQPAISVFGVANVLRQRFEAAPRREDPAEQQDDGRRWTKILDRLRTLVAEVRNEAAGQEFWKQALLDPTPDFMIGIAAACAQEGLAFENLDLKVSETGLSEAMVKLIESSPDLYLDVLPYLFSFLGGVPASHVESFVAKLEATSKTDQGPVLRAALFFYGHDRDALREKFVPLAKKGTFAWYAMNAADERCKGDELFFSLVFGAPSGQIRGSENTAVIEWYRGIFTSAELDENLVDGVAKAIEETDDVVTWLDLAVADASSHGNIKNIVRSVDLDQAPITRVRYFFEHLETFSDIIGIDGTLAVLAASSDGPALEAAAAEFAPHISTELLEAMAVSDNHEATRATLRGVDRFLTELPVEAWVAHLTDPTSHELRVLIARAAHGFRLPSATVVPAVAAAAVDMLEGKFQPALRIGRYAVVLEALPSRSLPQAASILMTKLEKADVTQEGAEAFVEHLAPLAARLKIDESGDAADRAIEKLIWFLVQSQADASKTYLRENAAVVRRCLDMADAETRQGVIDEVADLGDDAEWPAELRKLLKLPQSKKKGTEKTI